MPNKKKGKRTSEKEYWAAYKATEKWTVNKIKKLRKHCENHPEDAQSAKKLEDRDFSYPNRKPTKPGTQKKEYRKDRVLKWDEKILKIRRYRTKYPVISKTTTFEHPFKILCTLY